MQQGYNVQHREIKTLFWNNLKNSTVYKNTESLWCTPETNIVNYMSIKKWEKKSNQKKSIMLYTLNLYSAVCQLYLNKTGREKRVNSNVNYGLWVIIICQYRLINCNKYTTLLGDVDNGEGCACVW